MAKLSDEWENILDYLPYNHPTSNMTPILYRKFLLKQKELKKEIESLYPDWKEDLDIHMLWAYYNMKWNHILYMVFESKNNVDMAVEIFHVNGMYDYATIVYQKLHKEMYKSQLKNFYSSYLNDGLYPNENDEQRITPLETHGLLTKSMIKEILDHCTSYGTFVDYAYRFGNLKDDQGYVKESYRQYRILYGTPDPMFDDELEPIYEIIKENPSMSENDAIVTYNMKEDEYDHHLSPDSVVSLSILDSVKEGNLYLQSYLPYLYVMKFGSFLKSKMYLSLDKYYKDKLHTIYRLLNKQNE